MFGVVHQRGELGHFGLDMIANGAPLRSGGLGGVLGDKGRDDLPPAFLGIGKSIALEVNPAPLPGGAKNLRDSRFHDDIP